MQPGKVVTEELDLFLRIMSEYGKGDVVVVKDLFGKVCASDQVKFLPLSAQYQCVRLDEKMVVLSYADHKNLFLVIIGPHKGAKLPESFIFVENLSVIAYDKKNTKLSISFSVYSAPYSPTVEDRTRVSSVAAAFVLDALQQHLLEETASLTAHGLLKSRHFLETSRICMGDAQICIAASQTDFNYLSSRFVDYRGRRPFLSGAVLLDCENDDAWDDERYVILIGGESGSGKTWEMITNFHKRTDLTVYIRPLGDDEFSGVAVILPEEWKLLNDPDSCQRDSCFHTCVTRAVENAIEAVCPPLSSKLKEYIGPSPFRVRICFD
ncbi:Hypothetical protein, putative, partial [Bodo saltans]